MDKLLPSLLFILFSALALPGYSQVDVGQALPPLQIEEPGELILEGEDTIVYQPWSTETLVGKVHVVQYLAGRLGVKDMNKAFTDALEAKEYSGDLLHNTTIINLNDTMFGTSGIVNSQLKGNKIKYWYSSIVADRDGDGADAWQLKRKNSAIILLSPSSEVLFFKDGQLDETEIASVVAMIDQQIELLKADGNLAKQ